MQECEREGAVTVLSQASGVAAVILAIEIFVVNLAVLVALYVVARALGQLVPRVRLWLRTGFYWLLQAEEIVITLMRWLLAPILFLSGLRAGLGAGARALRRR